MSKKVTFNVFICLLISFIGKVVNGQNQYFIDGHVDLENKTLIVSQTLTFKNPSNKSLEKIYLSDWANSYEGTKSPLVKHLANQFNRSFYLSSKSKLGFTNIESLSCNNNKLEWSRIKGQLDLIEITLENPLKDEEKITINLNYQIKIPDDKFTGYGINSNNRIFFRDFFISLNPFINDEWILQSNFGLRDNSNISSNYLINWTYPESYNLVSNLNQIDIPKSFKNGYISTLWMASNLSSPEFIFDEEDNFKTINLDDHFTIVTDIIPKKNSEVDIEQSLKQIYNFTNSLLSPLKQKKILILKKDYAKNPLVGITEVVPFLNPFSDSFIYETKFIKAYLATYLH